VKDFLKIPDSVTFIRWERQNFTLNLILPENLKSKNKNGIVIFCLLTEY